jgi:phenylacetate-CoA ligase
MGVFEPPDLRLPASREAIRAIQSARKPVALAQARKAPYYQGKLDHIDPAKLDDPEEWAKIPILDKDTLRGIGVDRFNDQFLIAPPRDIIEFWRSGGATGVPLFYPRSRVDMDYCMVQLCRCWDIVGCGPDDILHNSFPLGVHPAGHLWARSANLMGIGVMWAGGGVNTPSQTQLELIVRQRPTLWMGMPSYGLHLANMAAAQGIDLAGGSVRKVLVGAEALSAAKREKLERMWGAEVHDLFGMTEIGILGADSRHHEGFHIWTDQAVFEVVDEATGLPVAPGRPGLMVITPLFVNTATPFLRWSSGDIVTISEDHSLDGPYGVFPAMRHAHRTAGFWKLRGVNINHAEFEDFLFAMPAVNDFKVEARTLNDRERLYVGIEIPRAADGAAVGEAVAAAIRATFEVRPDVEVLETGTLAREFEASVKAPRFVDRRA